MASSARKNTTLDHILKYTGIFGGVQGLSLLIGVVRNKLAAAFLGTTGFGLMAIYSSITDLVASSSNLGLPIASVQRLSEIFDEGSETKIKHFVVVVRTWCCWAALLGVTLTMALSPLLASLFFEGEDERIFDIMLLSPMIAAIILSAGETSILKGLRHLKRVATISALSAVATLCLTVPFFWAMGLRGIIISLNATSLAVLIINLFFTTPLYPWRISFFSQKTWREGRPLLRVGVPYIIAAIAGSGSTMLLQAMLKRESSEETLGLYRAAYMVMISYAGIVFSAFDADYFPRLSSVNHDEHARNDVINQQARASLTIVAPLLTLMLGFMPLIFTTLFNDSFLPAVSMSLCAVFYTFLRCLSIPISYTAIACGHSLRYLVMEIIYDIVSLGIITVLYHYYDLTGAGIGLSASALFDLLVIGFYYGHCYNIRLERSTWRIFLVQLAVVSACLGICLLCSTSVCYIAGTLLFVISAWFSYSYLRHESDFIGRIGRKLLRHE